MRKADGKILDALANIDNDETLRNRCREVYMMKVGGGQSCEKVAKKLNLHLSTVARYVNAYRKYAVEEANFRTPDDMLLSLEGEVELLREKRKGSTQKPTKLRDFNALSKTILQILNSIAELKGFINRQPVVNVNLVQNVLALVTSSLPDMLETLIDKQLTRDDINNVMVQLAERIEDESVSPAT